MKKLLLGLVTTVLVTGFSAQAFASDPITWHSPSPLPHFVVKFNAGNANDYKGNLSYERGKMVGSPAHFEAGAESHSMGGIQGDYIQLVTTQFFTPPLAQSEVFQLKTFNIQGKGYTCDVLGQLSGTGIDKETSSKTVTVNLNQNNCAVTVS